MATLKSRWMTAKQYPLGVLGFWIHEKKKRRSYLGDVVFCKDWKFWVFKPKEFSQFSDRCLLDLSNFLAELNKEKK